MKKLLLLIFLAMPASSATRERRADENRIIIDVESEAKPRIEIVKVVPLEYNDSCVIDRYSRLTGNDSCWFVYSYKTVTVFDKAGKHLHTIDAIGKAENEFLQVGDVSVSPHENILWINDQQSKKLLKFDETGKCTEVQKYSKYYYDFEIIGDRIFGDIFVNSDSPYSLVVMDKRHRIQKEEINKVRLERTIDMSSYNKFSWQNETLYYVPSFSNCIYRIEKDGAKLAYRFDFGDHWADSVFVKDQLGSKSLSEFRKRLDREKKLYFLGFNRNTRFLNLYFWMNKCPHNLFYDLETGKQYLNVSEEESGKKGALDEPVWLVEDDLFVTMVDAYKIASEPIYADIRAKYDIGEDSNPVIICYKIKG